MRYFNPFAFRPLQVTFWTSVIYLAVIIPLVCVQESVPAAPSESALPLGISITEAWSDLGNLTQFLHPVNSHANDNVREFLLYRIREILSTTGATWTTETGHASMGDVDAVIFDDLVANISFTTSYSHGRRAGLYFEGSNIYVYIRGTRDAPGNWWEAPADSPESESMKKQTVLVNAHFDSVSSSFGATDDGVGVVSCLQLIRFFTTPGNQPERGILILLNNAEEEFLLGATAFANSPMVPYIGTFVNLEGAGAGGRAMLFRSTDLEVMGAYRKARHPTGTVVANDGFKMNLIRSETDYRVWVNALGFRGLDIAFMKPRVRYHTTQDDRRHTSTGSVWHMLSGALASAKALSGSVGNKVEKTQTDAVWFDMFGDSLVLFALRGLFAWSLTILIVTPLLIALVFFLLYKFDKNYMFCASITPSGNNADDGAIPLGGWKGFSRYPVALVIASAFDYGAAFLLHKVQPFIIYGNLYAVIALMVSLFYFVFWCIMRGASFTRPSALHRAYSLLWLYVLSWILLVGATVLEDQSHVASGYVIVFWTTSVFVALLVSLLEQFSLKKKSIYVEELDSRRDSPEATDGDDLMAPSPGEGISESAIDEPSDVNGANDDYAPTETSPLIGGSFPNNRPTTFTTGYHRSRSAIVEERRRAAAAANDGNGGGNALELEQDWSKMLPTWTWLIQFLVLGPVNIIIIGQLLLVIGVAIQQTGTDGSNLLMPYLILATFTILLLSPLTPFIHRIIRHVPLFFGAAFVALLVYDLVAFPFSITSPFKFTIRQTFSVDYKNSSVILTGYEGYIDVVIASLPSAAGRPVTCTASAGRQIGLLDCAFDGTGLEPRVEVDGPDTPFPGNFDSLISFNGTRSGSLKVTLDVDAVNTKACALHFDQPVRNISVRGGQPLDTRIDFDAEPAPEDGDWELGDFTLWRRDWETPWTVDVDLADTGSNGAFSGQVICRWGDANTPGTAPAVDEAWKYAPPWSILTVRQNPPLVQGSKMFSV